MGAQPLPLKRDCRPIWASCALQVVGIIESHARAVDLMTHNYYELLYAFHIYRHNYRKGKARCSSLSAWDAASPVVWPVRALG